MGDLKMIAVSTLHPTNWKTQLKCMYSQENPIQEEIA